MPAALANEPLGPWRVDGLAENARDGFEFVTMAEAGEAGPWEVFGTLNKRTGDSDRLAARRLGATDQQKHLETVRSASLTLAEKKIPTRRRHSAAGTASRRFLRGG